MMEYALYLWGTGISEGHSSKPFIKNTKIKGMNPSSVTSRLRLMEHALYLWGIGISKGHSNKPFN